jgi:hypothetical protein
MANVNTFSGWYNITQTIGGTSETTLLVPSASTYPGLPSPALAAGTGLFVQPPPDVTGSELDGHPFRVRISGVVNNGASNSFTLNLYLGTSSTIASNTQIATFSQVAATTANYPFIAELLCIWDSTSTKLWLASQALLDGIFTALSTSHCTVTTVSTVAGLQFIPSFTFATANASDSVLVREFTLERV